MKPTSQFLAGALSALLLVLAATCAAFLSACVTTTVTLPKEAGGGQYSRTAFLSSQSADRVEVQLGPDKKVIIEKLGTDSTSVAASALALANKVIAVAPK